VHADHVADIDRSNERIDFLVTTTLDHQAGQRDYGTVSSVGAGSLMNLERELQCAWLVSDWGVIVQPRSQPLQGGDSRDNPLDDFKGTRSVKTDEGDDRLLPDSEVGKGGLLLSTAAPSPGTGQDSPANAGATDIKSSVVKQEEDEDPEPFQVRKTILSDGDLTSRGISHSQRTPGGFPVTSPYSAAEGGSGVVVILVGAVVALIGWALVTRRQEAETQQKMEKALTEIIGHAFYGTERVLQGA
jgi:hypothetical protein